MTIYLCKDSVEDILCGVYDAWMSGKGHEQVRLELESNCEFQMFCVYQEVIVSDEKFKKVVTAIQNKISTDVYHEVYRASLSNHPDRADLIYRYLIQGFRYKKAVIDMLQLPEVHEIFKLTRAISREAHSYTGFVRFSQIREGALVAVIEPKNDILPLIAPHFYQRLSGEDWMIYDKSRGKAVIRARQKPWFMMNLEAAQWNDIQRRTDEIEYQQLWKVFFHCIAIKERTNPVCQRNHLPLRYRTYMDEFQDGPEKR